MLPSFRLIAATFLCGFVVVFAGLRLAASLNDIHESAPVMAAHAAPTSMAPAADREVRRGLSSVPVMYDLRFAVSTVSPALVRIAPTVLDRPAPPMIIVPPEDRRTARNRRSPKAPSRRSRRTLQLSRRRKRRPASTFQPIRRLRPRKNPRHQRRPPILRPTNLQPRVLPQQLPLHPALPHPALRPTSKLPASSRRQHRRPKPPPSSRRSASPAPLARLPRRSRTPNRRCPSRSVKPQAARSAPKAKAVAVANVVRKKRIRTAHRIAPANNSFGANSAFNAFGSQSQ